ncbi:hypothetical protein JCGZ_03944 [Jatropha curcas]|uniref:Uncharacterized protein n=1 Tax=Jatropha curcas TaxID=180498 RepID=A0A067JA55_JATCU|nr:hypothetical protein JCGZ_03944 [Jatropha curcas]
MAFRSQVSSFVQSISDDLWQIPPMDQLAWLRYFKDLKPNHGFLSWLVTHFNPNTMVFRFEDSEVTPTYEEMCAVMDHHPEQNEALALPPDPRYNLAKIAALCPVYLPDGINTDQGLPLEPFLNKNWRFLTSDGCSRHATVPSYYLYDNHGRNDVLGKGYCPSYHRLQCPSSRLSTAIASLGSRQVKSLIPPVPARLIPTYGAAIFQSRSRRRFDFGDNPTIRWTCPWWRIRMVTTRSMNLNYVLYASLDRSMAYFPDRISRYDTARSQSP